MMTSTMAHGCKTDFRSCLVSPRTLPPAIWLQRNLLWTTMMTARHLPTGFQDVTSLYPAFWSNGINHFTWGILPNVSKGCIP